MGRCLAGSAHTLARCAADWLRLDGRADRSEPGTLRFQRIEGPSPCPARAPNVIRLSRTSRVWRAAPGVGCLGWPGEVGGVRRPEFHEKR